MDSKLHWTCIAWAPHSRRSQVFARTFEGKLYCIHYLRFQSPLYAPAKYILQAIRTWQVLCAEHPQAIHVQSPPFVCGLVVYSYCMLTGAKFVLDYHSAAFARVWDWALPIQKLLARKAMVNIVTNQHWADLVCSWGACTLIMGDPFLSLPQGELFSTKSGFKVAFICTFAPDEPLEQVLEAAHQLPTIRFYITGNPKHKHPSENLPANVTCTGFLPDAQYIGLLKAVDVVMVLTTRDHTLQLGGCEAVSAGQPLITSDWPFLRDFFSKGTIYVANTAESIRDGILAMQTEHERLKEEMIGFRETGRQNWNAQFAKLDKMIAQALSYQKQQTRTVDRF
jgi:glycosyltransferase involved in cell wall biosynthesis